MNIVGLRLYSSHWVASLFFSLGCGMASLPLARGQDWENAATPHVRFGYATRLSVLVLVVVAALWMGLTIGRSLGPRDMSWETQERIVVDNERREGEGIRERNQTDSDSDPSRMKDSINGSSEDLRPQETESSCIMQADWVQTCLYRTVVCFNGSHVVFLRTDKEDGAKCSTAEGWDWRRWDPAEFPPPRRDFLPWQVRVSACFRHPDALESAHVEWLAGGMWIVPTETKTANNPFHWAMSTLGLWDMQRLNETWHQIPRMDHIVVVHSVTLQSWNINLLKAAVPDTATIYVPETYGPILRTHKGGEHMWCANQGGITSYKPRLFTGVGDAAAFRSRVYKQLNIREPPTPPRHVVLLKRPFSRVILNEKKIQELLDALGVSYTVTMFDHLDFVEQVRLMSTAGVLLTPHGAGATNIIFAPHRASLVELFPYHMFVNLYAEIAEVSGYYYYPVHMWNDTQVIYDQHDKERDETVRQKCMKTSSLGINNSAECLLPSKNSAIIAPLLTLEYALVNALQAAGHAVTPLHSQL